MNLIGQWLSRCGAVTNLGKKWRGLEREHLRELFFFKKIKAEFKHHILHVQIKDSHSVITKLKILYLSLSISPFLTCSSVPSLPPSNHILWLRMLYDPCVVPCTVFSPFPFFGIFWQLHRARFSRLSSCFSAVIESLAHLHSIAFSLCPVLPHSFSTSVC